MQIAIASSQGKSVDLHFGQTETFHIFSIKEGELLLNEKRNVTPYSVGDQSHAFDKIRFDSVVEALSGCSKIYCAKIGEKPKEELQNRGFEVFEFTGDIASISV